MSLTDVGDMVALSFNFQPLSSTSTNTVPNSQFRFGFYNSNGGTVVGDGNTNTATDFGYQGRFSVGDTGIPEALTLSQEIGTDGNLLSGTDGNGVLLSVVTTGTTRLAGGAAYSATMTITRTLTGVDLSFDVYDGLDLGGNLLASITASDTGNLRNAFVANTEPTTNQWYNTFNLIAFSSGSVDYNFRIDDVRVVFTPVPEPQFYALAALIVGGAIVGCRRWNRHTSTAR